MFKRIAGGTTHSTLDCHCYWISNVHQWLWRYATCSTRYSDRASRLSAVHNYVSGVMPWHKINQLNSCFILWKRNHQKNVSMLSRMPLFSHKLEKSWFLFLKQFLIAPSRFPTISHPHVYRGAKADLRESTIEQARSLYNGASFCVLVQSMF